MDPVLSASAHDNLLLCANRATAQLEAQLGYYRGARWRFGVRGNQWAVGSALDLLAAGFRVVEDMTDAESARTDAPESDLTRRARACPVSCVLESIVMSLAPPHVVVDYSPSWEELQALPAGAPIPIWSGASEHTVWSSPAVNYAFRAWHDATHLRLGRGFDRDSERAVAVAQVLEALAHGAGTLAIAVLLCETELQQDLFYATGEFPQDQRAFCLEQLRRMGL